MVSYQDTNGDGSYDEYEFYSFNTSRNASDQKGKTGKQQPQGSSKQVQVTGKIENSKKVMVRNGGERLVAQVASDQGKTFIVDLGRADQFGNQERQGQQAAQSSLQDQQRLQEGEQITVSGPMIKVSDKQVVVVQTVKHGDKQQQQINRSARTINGKITKMKGRAKEAAGALTNDDELRREGKFDQAAGETKAKSEQAIDRAKRAAKHEE